MPKILTPKPPTIFPIPAGTKPSKCKQCPEEIFFVGKQPLCVQPTCKSRSTGRVYETDAKAPTATEDGRGWSHFISCAQAPFFRRKR